MARLKADPRLARGRARARSSSRCGRRRRSSCSTSTASSYPVRERDVASCSTRRSSPASPLALARERFRMARAPPLLRALRRAARPARAAQLRRARAGAAARRLPHEAGSTACCRCRSPRSSSRGCSTSPSALEAASEGMLDDDEQKLLLRDRPPPHVRPALERPRPAAARRGADAARRRAALLRARDRRRGAGSLADAAARDLAPRGRRLADDPRRRRAGDRPGRLPPLAGAPAVSAGRGRDGRSRSCATRTACRPRSWTSRCRCSIGSRRTSSRRSPTAGAATRRGSSRSARTSCWRRRCARPPRSRSSTGCSR